MHSIALFVAAVANMMLAAADPQNFVLHIVSSLVCLAAFVYDDRP